MRTHLPCADCTPIDLFAYLTGFSIMGIPLQALVHAC